MRIVSLVPSLTEAVCQLGRSEALVGVTKYCIHPAEVVANVEKVGGTKNPDLARIRALWPNLVLANTDEQREQTLEELAGGPWDLLVTATDSLDQVEETWTQLGTALDRETTAARERHRLEAARVAAKTHAAGRERLSALIPVWKDPWMASGGGTYVGDLLAVCGFDNLLGAVEQKWLRFEPTLDANAAAAKAAKQGPFAGQAVHALPRRPEVVLLPTEPYAFAQADRHAFAGVGVDRANVRVVDGELLTWWLSRSVEALAYFSALHDELSNARRSPAKARR